MELSIVPRSRIELAMLDTSMVVWRLKDESLCPMGVKLTLGREYFSLTKHHQGYFSKPIQINPFNTNDAISIWGSSKCAEVIDGVEYVSIPPKGTVLCHTDEFIGCCKQFYMKTVQLNSNVPFIIPQSMPQVDKFHRVPFVVNNLSDEHLILPVGIPILYLEFYDSYSYGSSMWPDYRDVEKAWNVHQILPQ